MKHIFSALCLALITASCVSAQVDIDSACSSTELNFPGVPISVSNKAGERTASVLSKSDMSEPLSKIADYADVHVTSATLFIDSESDLSFLHHVKVTIHNDSDASNELVLSDATFSDLNLPVNVDRDKLAAMLRNGPVTMVATGTGNIPTAPIVATTTFCIGIHAQGDKSLSDLN